METFKTAFADINGSRWEDERDALLISDDMANLSPTQQSLEASRQWVEQLKTSRWISQFFASG